ncbi:unnamed protein product [Caretta caretta]
MYTFLTWLCSVYKLHPLPPEEFVNSRGDLRALHIFRCHGVNCITERKLTPSTVTNAAYNRAIQVFIQQEGPSPVPA